jgi:2'-hydroxyisoflavone reductase
MLVLGGTRFVGRAVVETAAARGHELTLFNRGQTNPELFPAVEKLRGDRSSDLSALSGRTWDAVIDVAAYFPHVVQKAVQQLAPQVDRYLFVSSVSVYADQSVPQLEEAELEVLSDPDDTTEATYGARKAACESVMRAAFADRATIVRPGMIVGPHDPTDRFAYWPRRVAEGGRVLAPGDPADPLQFIDVRDLADFIIHLIESGQGGVFNATGHPIPFGAFLDACREVTRSDAELVWVPSEVLLAAGLDPWMGVPMWIAAPGWEAASRVPIERALEAGLVFRPLRDTIAAAWKDQTPATLVTALPREREAEILRQAAGGDAGDEATATSAAPTPRLTTERLELKPLPAAAAAALLDDRDEASRILGATLATDWPQRDLLDVLPLQAAASAETERFGVWVMIEHASGSVVGDIGFVGAPDDAGSLEVGYSVVADRRCRGYATEAATAIVEWASSQPGVNVVVASCDSHNAASIRVLERAGFRRSGEANGQIRWRYASQGEQA